MRRTWIVVGVVVLALGIAVYRWGRSGSPSADDRAAAPQPIADGAPGEAAHPREQAATITGTTGSAGSTGSPAGAEPGGQAPGADAHDTQAKDETQQPKRRKWGASIDELAKAMAATPAPAPPSRTPATGPAAAQSGPAPAANKSTTKPAPQTPPPTLPLLPQPTYQRPAAVATQDTIKPGSAAPTVPDDPNADRRPAVLMSLRFDPPQVQDGGATVLSIGVIDDLSGVKSVFGTIRSPSEAAVVPFVGQDPGGTGVYTVSITIPKKAETGDWFVGTLQILDKADNPMNLAYMKSNVPPGGILHVTSQESDSTAPAVHGVSLEKQTIGGGETNRITVLVDDDGSGVGSVTGNFQSPTRSALLPFVCQARGDGTWSGVMTLPANADCGEWALKQLRVADKANNAAVLLGDAPELGHVAFNVASGGGCDSDPPVLDQVTVSPQTVSNTAPAQVTLTILAHDDGSGVAQLTGRVEGPVAANNQVPRIFFATQADSKNPTAPMVVTITVPQYAGTGIWRIASIELTDKARNMRRYDGADPMLVNATITVQ